MISKGELFETRGPLLLVANHPNSFLDAIIIGASCKFPVHFLARGDAFQKKYHRFLLNLLQMIPIYRMREGRDKLHLNSNSFVRTQEVLNKNGIVLIFIEGICVNSHDLQPFQKGAARIIMEYRGLLPLKVMPVCIYYGQIPAVYHKISISAGKLFKASDFLREKNTKAIVQHFNSTMKQELQSLLADSSKRISEDVSQNAINKKIIRYAMLPVFWPTSRIVYAVTKGTVFFDSVLFGALLFILPIWIFLVLSIFIFSIEAYIYYY
jgi:1-acyl-sn-glycerol-3-phosphate acyltransferase